MAFPKLRMGLRFRFSLTVGIVLLLIFASASSFLIRQSIVSEKAQLLAKARAFANLSVDPIGDAYSFYFRSGFLKFRENLIDLLALNRDIKRVQIIGVYGKILFDSIDLDNVKEDYGVASEPKVLEALGKSHPVEFTGSDEIQIIVPYRDDFGTSPFSVRYFFSYQSIYENINRAIVTIFLLTLLLLLLAVSTTIFLVTKSIISPVEKIARSAKEISSGNLDQQIELRTGDELEDLASSLNNMKVSLRKSIESLRQLDKLKDEFIFLASHNLRTPLTIIKGYLEILRSSQKIEGKARQDLEIALSGVADLESVIESLVSVVSLSKKKILEKAKVNLVKLVEEIVEDIKEEAAEKKVKVEFARPKDIPEIWANRVKLKQALSEVVENSIKFNKEGGNVMIKVRRTNDNVLVSIADSGIGISDNQKENLFKKFYRGSGMLTYNYEGLGLGLFITKLIIQAHHGRIWFESRQNEGTTFYISLPIKGG